MVGVNRAVGRVNLRVWLGQSEGGSGRVLRGLWLRSGWLVRWLGRRTGSCELGPGSVAGTEDWRVVR